MSPPYDIHAAPDSYPRRPEDAFRIVHDFSDLGEIKKINMGGERQIVFRGRRHCRSQHLEKRPFAWPEISDRHGDGVRTQSHTFFGVRHCLSYDLDGFFFRCS